MRPKLLHGWIEAVFLGVCLAIGLTIAFVFAPQPSRPVVGVLHFEGLIEPASAQQMAAILDAARRDDSLAAVVMEIDSYGGLSTSSESLYHAMLQLRQEKPLAVVIDGAATSGAYYMAVAGNKLYATASSEIGNVGAWTMRPSDPQVYADVISTGPYKLSGGSRFDAIRQLQLTRDAFVASVVYQRKQSPENPLKIDQTSLAEGRVYMGTEALALGLIDELGATADAVLWVAGQAGLANYQVEELSGYLDMEFDAIGLSALSGVLDAGLPGSVLLLDSRVPAALRADQEASTQADKGALQLRAALYAGGAGLSASGEEVQP